ncbi:MAG: iron-sulfur cluster assembly scaffold protein [Candidatus Zixiibacteriota bacterium]|nr:MAG: iron-sulfur cluster assembly scaffold protein [candidate division Zixibacteria bacterium]
MYNKTIMEHFQNPRNVGEIDNADGVGEAGNPETGDVMRIYLRIADGRIVEAKHKTFGNAIAIAVSSISTLMIVGLTLDQAAAITKEEVSDALGGIPEDKMNCSNMAPAAIASAVKDYRSKHA